jgi:hypothetical protein
MEKQETLRDNITHFETRPLITTAAPRSIQTQNTNFPVLYCTVLYQCLLLASKERTVKIAVVL